MADNCVKPESDANGHGIGKRECNGDESGGDAGEGSFSFLVPPPPKRRLVIESDGRLRVALSSAAEAEANTSANVGDDLEHCTLTEKEEVEFGLLSNPGSETDGPTVSGTDTASASYRSLVSGSTGGNPYEDGIAMADRLEDAYFLHRGPVLLGEKFATPMAVLHDLAKKYGTEIHFEYHEIRTAKDPMRILAEIYVGNRKGYGEASTKKLACHMAAAHLLRKLETLGKYSIPPYYLIPGCRINPRIFRDLSVFCNLLEVQKPMYIIQPRDPELKDAPLYTVKCQIGSLITIGESDSLYLARRWAAKSAFESLAGKMVPLDFVFCGQACMSLIHAKILPSSSRKKLIARMNRGGSFKGELKTGPNSGAEAVDKEHDDTDSINNNHTASNLDTGFDEELDKMFDGDGDFKPQQPADEETKQRINSVIETMADEVKEKLFGLRIAEKEPTDETMEGNSVAAPNNTTEKVEAEAVSGAPNAAPTTNKTEEIAQKNEDKPLQNQDADDAAGDWEW